MLLVQTKPVSLSLPSLSYHIRVMLHPSKSAAQITGGIVCSFKMFLGEVLACSGPSPPSQKVTTKGALLPSSRFPSQTLVFALQPHTGSSRKISRC